MNVLKKYIHIKKNNSVYEKKNVLYSHVLEIITINKLGIFMKHATKEKK